MTMAKISTLLRTATAATALAFASMPALAVEPFSADYEASYMGMQGNGRMTVEPVGDNRWRYSLSIRNSLADLSQSTVFEERDGRLRPLSGTDSSKVLIKKSDKQASYDWNRGVATWTGDVKADRSGPIRLQAGDLDALLVNLALVRDLAADKPLRYRMVDNGRVKQMSYTVAGTETIDVGGKPREATKVVSNADDKQTIAWIVEGMPVPARIVQKEDGKESIDLRVQSVR
jgi:hypothetical protein